MLRFLGFCIGDVLAHSLDDLTPLDYEAALPTPLQTCSIYFYYDDDGSINTSADFAALLIAQGKKQYPLGNCRESGHNKLEKERTLRNQHSGDTTNWPIDNEDGVSESDDVWDLLLKPYAS